MKDNREKRGAASSDCNRPDEVVAKLKVVCPYYAVCEFGRQKAKNNRHRCYGTLIEVEATAARLAISYKCDKSKRVMMMVISGDRVWHIKPQSVEYGGLLKLLKPQRCGICERRLFDAHVFMGRAKIQIKCPRDSQEWQYQLLAAGLQAEPDQAAGIVRV